MNTIDQAFVQAFARRNRPAAQSETTSPAATTIQTDGESLRVDPAVVANTTADPTQLAPGSRYAVNQSASVVASATAGAVPMPTTHAQPAPVAPALAPDNADHPTEVFKHRIDQPEPISPASKATTSEPAAEPVGATPIQPIWEVDRFDIPEKVADLFFEEALFESVAKRMKDAVDSGLRSMMVTSVQSGEGRSTVAIGMAIAASATGLNVALIDGDIYEPTLVNDMRLDVEFGWLDTLRGGLPVEQIAVYSIEDNLTLIPLMPTTVEAAATEYEVERILDSLKNRFDLVIVDSSSGETSLVEKYAGTVDSGVITHDMSRTDMSAVNELAHRLKENGLHGVGVVDNFC